MTEVIRGFFFLLSRNCLVNSPPVPLYFSQSLTYSPILIMTTVNMLKKKKKVVKSQFSG